MAEKYNTDEEKIIPENTVVLKEGGMFFNAYDEAAFVLSQLTNYKVVMVSEKAKPKCGFPTSKIDTVIEILDAAHVTYLVKRKDSELSTANSFDNNQYQNALNRFDKSKIIKKWIKPEDTEPPKAKEGQRYITFSCPEKIAERVDEFIEEYTACFGDMGNNKDFLMSWLLSAGLNHKDNMLIGQERK